MKSAYLYGHDDVLIAWAERHIPGFRARSDAKAIGHVRDEALVGVVVYDTFTSSGCLVHLASDGRRRWMTREFAFRAMAFPFLQCRFRRIGAVVSTLNAESLAFTRRFGGWVEEGRLRRCGDQGEDMILFGMLREECAVLAPPWRIGPRGATGQRDRPK